MSIARSSRQGPSPGSSCGRRVSVADRVLAEASLSDRTFHVALYHPEIPQNTGNIGRLCLAVDATLHLVHPLSFETDEKAVRRAGLDYWKHVRLVEHEDEAAFWAWVADRRVLAFSSAGGEPYTRIRFVPGDVLLFGRETVGLPREILAERGAHVIPMVGATRSLNVANAAAIIAYEALRQLRPELF